MCGKLVCVHAEAETKILQRANFTMELVMKDSLSIRTMPKDACFNFV